MASEEIIIEENVLELLRKQDPQGIEILYNSYAHALFGVIYKIVPDENICAEILEQTFVKLWRDFNAFHPAKGRLFTYLLSLARNLALEKAAGTQYLQPEAQISSYKLDIAEQPLPEHIALKDVQERLRPELKDLIDLILFKGATQAQAAEKLKLPLGTVKTRVRNAMVELRKIFRI